MPFPCLGLAGGMAAEDLTPQDLEMKPEQLKIGPHKIKINHLNQAIPQFLGPAGTIKTISFVNVINGQYKPADFRDKIVLVGLNCPEDGDTFPPPFSTTNMVKSGTPETPGVEIHATVVHNFIHDSWYKPVPELFNVFILLLTAFFTTFSLRGRRPIRGILLTLLIIVSVTTLALFYGRQNDR